MRSLLGVPACVLLPGLFWVMLAPDALFGAAPDPTNAATNAVSQARKAQDFIDRFATKAASKTERRKALQELYRSTDTLTQQEKKDAWRSIRSVAADKTEDAALRADTILTLRSLGMKFKHEKTLANKEIVQDCGFLLDLAADQSEDSRVRHVSITTIGNLQLKEAVPLLNTLLADAANLHRPEIARPSCVALATLSPEGAIPLFATVLDKTTNSAVFGSAAYALGQTKSSKTLGILVRNRLRLNDNLSIDNALQEICPSILKILTNPSDPDIVVAIKATRSLWRDEQKVAFRPLLEKIAMAAHASIDVRREAVHRLIDDAYMLALPDANLQLSAIARLIEKEPAFENELKPIQKRLHAHPAPSVSTHSQP